MDSTTSNNNMRKMSLKRLQIMLALTATMTATGFMQSPAHNHSPASLLQKTAIPSHSTLTALSVWWLPGSDMGQDNDSGEQVAIKIEKKSVNSRRISGKIVIPRPVDDVWAILTDYDNLSTHVPNLVESKRVNALSTKVLNPNGAPGDGTYECRLFQKGAQKIAGFEFGASVTMDMVEKILGNDTNEKIIIKFKCVESQFFSEFDGEWKVSWTTDAEDPSKLACLVEYTVDVRPRGPVPVQALEWRIREDVPINLRAVKVASMDVGLEGIQVLSASQRNKGQEKMAYRAGSTLPQRIITTKRSSDVPGKKENTYV